MVVSKSDLARFVVVSGKSACRPRARADKPPSFALLVVAEWEVVNEIGEWFGSSLLYQRISENIVPREAVSLTMLGSMPKDS